MIYIKIRYDVFVAKKKHSFDWYCTRWGGNTAVCLIRFWAFFHRTTDYRIELDRPIDPDEVTVMASNHQTLLDPPAAFAALTFKDLLKISPVKFMTWHKYYNSLFKLPLYATGCFPSHGPGLTGVRGAIHFTQNSYRAFLFPEGKRTKPHDRKPAYPGISQILTESPQARLILVHIDWEVRTSFWSRPKLLVHYIDAPKKLDRTNPDAIMNAVYDMK